MIDPTADGATRMSGVPGRVAAAFERAERVDGTLGCFLRTFPAQAMATAERLEELAAGGGRPGPLHGMLVAVKDVLATAEAPATGQSRVYDAGWWRGRDATAVRRLRAAGAVIVGKTTLAEHAIGRPDPTSGLPTPRNPWDLDRWTGGSSCGSANGLPAGLFTVGIGTDTNGSVRIPAALCGVTGFKPTYGLVPAGGCLPLARSLDTIGTLARDVWDCLRVLAVLADPGTPAGDLSTCWREDLVGVRIGVPYAMLAADPGITDECRRVFDQALADLRELGAELVPLDLPVARPLLAAQLITLLVEAFDAHRGQLLHRWPEFGRPFRRTVVFGGLLDATALGRARRTRDWARNVLLRHFDRLDAIATPTWPAVAPRYDDAAGLGATSGLPGLWNAVGFPAVALPMGWSGGLPLSLQLAGPPWRDARLAAIADRYQRHTGWHLGRPRLDAAPPAPVVLTDPAAGAVEAAGELEKLLAGLGLSVPTGELAVLAGTWAVVSGLPAALPESLPED